MFKEGHKTPESPISTEMVGRLQSAATLSFGERIKLIRQDPKMRAALDALLRSAANIGLSVLDFVPIVGDVSEAGVIGAKLGPRAWGMLQKGQRVSEAGRGQWDLLPDINNAAASTYFAASLPTETIFGTSLPSYVVPTLMQLRADIKQGRFSELKEVIYVLIVGRPRPSAPEKIQLDSAATVFDKERN